MQDERDLFLTLAIEKVKIDIPNYKEPEVTDQVDLKPISIKIYFGDGSTSRLVQNNEESFDRNIALNIKTNPCELPEGVFKHFPTQVEVFQGDERVGDVDLGWLEEYKDEVVDSVEMEGEPKSYDSLILRDLKLGPVVDNMFGVVRMYISLDRQVAPSSGLNGTRCPGEEDDEELFLSDDEDILNGRKIVACDRVIDPDQICGPCGNPNCPIAQTIKEELRKLNVAGEVR